MVLEVEQFRMGLIQMKCIQCGKSFKQILKGVLWCSGECEIEYYKRARGSFFRLWTYLFHRSNASTV